MRVSTVLTLLMGAASAVALAQDPAQSSRSRDPQQGGVRAQDSQSTTTSTTTTDSASVVTGHVVRYEPGRVIVVRDASNQERTFNLGPGVTLPVDIHVGSYVELATESNGVNVTRVQSGTMNQNMSGSTSGGNTWGTGTTGTTSGTGTSGSATTPSQMNQDYSSSQQGGTSGTSGTTTTTTGTTQTYSSSGSQGTLPKTGATGTTTTTTTNTWVSGTVTAFTPGQSVTIAMPGGTTVEYRIDSSSDIPTDLAIGKVVKIQTDTGGEGSQRVARHITYSTKTTTHHKKTTTGTSSPR